MKTSTFNYHLPEELIAQSPAHPRDSSRLLVYNRSTQEVVHSTFDKLDTFLKTGDLLVRNNTKVLPARLFGIKRGGSAKFEFLLLRRLSLTDWEVILKPARRLQPGGYVDFAPNLAAKLLEKKADGVCLVSFEYEGVFEQLLEEYGHMPLPPYITKTLEDKAQYQTVYAQTDGSAAAPTAGLHFTQRSFQSLQKKGIETEDVLLHVGLGTFRPMKEERVEDHIMHNEYYSITQPTANHINQAKTEGRRIVAVGTTAVRTLETAADDQGMIQAGEGDTNIFIYPGYTFRAVDVLLTNFHLPQSTLLMLVCAFAGTDATLKLYQEAVEHKYRFFSFGDAMLLL